MKHFGNKNSFKFLVGHTVEYGALNWPITAPRTNREEKLGRELGIILREYVARSGCKISSVRFSTINVGMLN